MRLWHSGLHNKNKVDIHPQQITFIFDGFWNLIFNPYPSLFQDLCVAWVSKLVSFCHLRSKNDSRNISACPLLFLFLLVVYALKKKTCAYFDEFPPRKKGLQYFNALEIDIALLNILYKLDQWKEEKKLCTLYVNDFTFSWIFTFSGSHTLSARFFGCAAHTRVLRLLILVQVLKCAVNEKNDQIRPLSSVMPSEMNIAPN